MILALRPQCVSSVGMISAIYRRGRPGLLAMPWRRPRSFRAVL